MGLSHDRCHTCCRQATYWESSKTKNSLVLWTRFVLVWWLLHLFVCHPALWKKPEITSKLSGINSTQLNFHFVFAIFSFTLGWVDVMSVPILGLSLGYMYHPLYPSPKYEVPRGEPLPCDPTQWEPDVISLELEAGPAALRMFGSLLAMLAAIKVW